MPLEPPRSRYRQLAGLIREAIERGDYAPGSTLESESQLAERYSVNRQTVNRAMLLLRGEGLLRVERGNRTVVRELPVLTTERIGRQQPARREAGAARGAFQAELASLGYGDHVEVAISRELRAPAHILAIFGADEPPEGQGPKRDPRRIDTGHSAVVRRREMYAAEGDRRIPVQLATGYYPLDIAGDTQIEQEDTGPGGTYSRLAELGHAPARFSERVTFRVPDEAEAAFLQLDVEQRVIEVERIARNARGRAVEVNVIVMPAHQWQLVYEWPAD